MSWVSEALQELTAGRSAKVRPRGGSMRGRIESGDLVTIEPVAISEIRTGDAVLVRWGRNWLLHLVKEIRGGEFLIGNNIGKINGWVPGSDIVGRVVEVVHDAGG